MATILKISEAAVIAIHAAALLTKNQNSPVTTWEAAKTLEVSAAHLSKVFQRMAKTGLVKPVRGPGGGFILNKPPREIRLADILESIEGPVRLSNCLMGTPKCASRCILGGLLDSVNKQVAEKLETRLSEI